MSDDADDTWISLTERQKELLLWRVAHDFGGGEIDLEIPADTPDKRVRFKKPDLTSERSRTPTNGGEESVSGQDGGIVALTVLFGGAALFANSIASAVIFGLWVAAIFVVKRFR